MRRELADHLAGDEVPGRMVDEENRDRVLAEELDPVHRPVHAGRGVGIIVSHARWRYA